MALPLLAWALDGSFGLERGPNGEGAGCLLPTGKLLRSEFYRWYVPEIHALAGSVHMGDGGA